MGSKRPSRDTTRLSHIEAACGRIAAYTADGRDSLADDRTYEAVLHSLMIIGEALGALSPATYARLTSLPRSAPVAMRNVIVHEYWRVQEDAVWKTVSLDLPALRADVERVLAGDH